MRLRGLMAGVSLLAMAGALAPVQASAPTRLEIFAPDAPAASSTSLLPLDPSAATLTEASAALQIAPNLKLETTGSVFDPIGNSGLDVPQSYAMPEIDLPSLRFDQAQGAAAAASLDWSLSDWAGLSLSAEHSAGALGFDQAFVYKPILFDDKESNSTVGLAAHVQLGNGWVTTFSYDVGVTQLDLKPAISFGDANQSQGRAYTVAIAKHGLFGDADSLKLSVTRPADNFVGNLNLGDGDFAGPIDLLGSYHRVTLPGDSAETDVGLGYVTTFFGGALALQANAGYQMNVAGQSGENSLTVLSRAKINF